MQTSYLNLKKYMKSLTLIENKYLKDNIENIKIGDILLLTYLVPEGNKERLQKIQGLLIKQKNSGINKTITIRRIIQNIGLEQNILLHSPKLISINIKQHSKVRRAKLYYLRTKVGRSKKLKQKF